MALQIVVRSGNSSRRVESNAITTRFPVPDPSVKADNVTHLLRDVDLGKPGAFDALIPVVYEELCVLARHHLHNGGMRRNGQTLHTTALVHEAYVRLAGTPNQSWQSRLHFFAVAAKAMRCVLVDHARRRNAVKRDSGRTPMPLDEALAVFDDHQLDVLALDMALARLAEVDERKARTVEMRFFAGMTNAEIAQALGISEPTVERDWRMAKAWLQRELDGGPHSDPL